MKYIFVLSFIMLYTGLYYAPLCQVFENEVTYYEWFVYVYVSSSCLHANQQRATTLVLLGHISFLKTPFCFSHESDSNGIVNKLIL